MLTGWPRSGARSSRWQDPRRRSLRPLLRQAGRTHRCSASSLSTGSKPRSATAGSLALVGAVGLAMAALALDMRRAPTPPTRRPRSCSCSWRSPPRSRSYRARPALLAGLVPSSSCSSCATRPPAVADDLDAAAPLRAVVEPPRRRACGSCRRRRVPPLPSAEADARDGVAVLVVSLAAVLATPSLLDTARTTRASSGARPLSGTKGLWAPLSFDMPLDIAFFVAGVPLVLAALASRPPVLGAHCAHGTDGDDDSGRPQRRVARRLRSRARGTLAHRRARMADPAAASLTGMLAAMLAVLLAVSLARAVQPSGRDDALRTRRLSEGRSRPDPRR